MEHIHLTVYRLVAIYIPVLIIPYSIMEHIHNHSIQTCGRIDCIPGVIIPYSIMEHIYNHSIQTCGHIHIYQGSLFHSIFHHGTHTQSQYTIYCLWPYTHTEHSSFYCSIPYSMVWKRSNKQVRKNQVIRFPRGAPHHI